MARTLQEPDDTVDVADEWGDQLVELRIGADPAQLTLVGLGTARSTKLPVALELLAHEPGSTTQGPVPRS